MKRLAIIVAILAFGGAQAQSAYNIGGAVLDHDIISTTSMLSLSQRQSFGTARSMAMGGAFTSLGGDIASIGTNPAGLGMYRHNDIALTLNVGINRATNSATPYREKNNTTTRLAINNIGGSFKVYEGSGKLIAVNLGVAYNKVADFNYSTSFASPNNVGSLADAFADMANGGGLMIQQMSDGRYISDPAGRTSFDMNPYYWGAVLGYMNGLINNTGSGWLPDEIGNGAAINHYYDLESRGAAAEYSLAVGANYNNLIYFGVSLDIQSISRKQSLYYGEEIGYTTPPAGDALPYRLNYFNYNQSMRINGSGIGAKFGITIRPLKELRIGVALHTPTYYSLTYRYAAQMSSRAFSAGSNPDGYELQNGYIYADETTPQLVDDSEYRWCFTTPLRVLVGASYTIANMAIVSIDYQYDGCQGIRVKRAPYSPDEMNYMIRSEFRGSHTVRGGVEVKPHPVFALRVGGGYIDRMVRSTNTIFSEPVTQDAWYCTAGVGFRLSRMVSLDLAYSYRSETNSDYYLYYSVADSGASNESRLYSTDYTRHNVALTLGVRF